MSALDALAIVAAGLAAGTINVIVGWGSLITFPTLLALGYPPVLANVSNNVGLVPGNISATVAYRREQRRGHHRSVHPQRHQQPVQVITGRARLVARAHQSGLGR